MSKSDGKLSVALKDKRRENEPKSRPHEVGRFSLFFAILKGRFGRLMLVNALTLLAALPMIAILLYRNLALSAGEMTGPYGAFLGVGYPIIPKIVGLLEYGAFTQDLFFLALLFPAAAVLCISLAGGAYLCCNLVKTEGVYYFSDFKRGIKQNYLQVLYVVLFFLVFVYLAKTVDNVATWQMSIGSPKWVAILSKVLIYILLALALMVSLWMVSLAIGYKMGFFSLLKNAVILTVGTFPQTLFFAALAAAPVILLLLTKQVVFIIVLVFFSLVGFSFVMLLWVSYTQWVFDKFLTPEETREEKLKAQREQEKPLSKEELVRIATAFERSVLISRPISALDGGKKPYLLPESYSREDLKKIELSRLELTKEADDFAKEHLNEPRYLDFNKKWEERTEALPTTGKKRKKRPKTLKR